MTKDTTTTGIPDVRIDSTEAGKIIGVTASHIGNLISAGYFPSVPPRQEGDKKSKIRIPLVEAYAARDRRRREIMEGSRTHRVLSRRGRGTLARLSRLEAWARENGFEDGSDDNGSHS